jgi:hypothetical protein
MKRLTIGFLLAGSLASLTPAITATGDLFFWKERPKFRHSAPRDKSFQRVGTLANYRNNGDAAFADETVSEIISATENGKTLVYTDGVRGTIGFIDITTPGNPQPAGIVVLDPDPDDDVEYSPTSVAVLGNKYALVAANTSESLTNTSGKLVVVDVATHAIVTEIELGGQPDSVRISHDRRYVAIVIENERNEDLCVGGSEDGTEADEEDCIAGGGILGALPQTPYGNPPGFLAVLRINPNPLSWGAPATVELTGLTTYAPEDPEPEFVDINEKNEAVVTLQENNHIAIVDLATLTIKNHFSAGSTTLNGVDLTDDGVISLTETLSDVAREPDAVAWVPAGFGRLGIATANEGDLFGGSRGFSIYRRDGSIAFDSGNALEELAVQHGHYPEGRSANKGTEPEAITYGRFGDQDYLFVATERGSFVAIYKLDRFGRPRFEQLLPGPLGPEGLLTIPGRNLLVLSGETDLEGFNTRSTVMIYELKRGEPRYPLILSETENGSPIPWSALSGMVSIPWRSDSLLAVWDSAYTESNIFRIDVSDKPAVITDSLTLKGGRWNYDPEGIAIAPDLTLWIASEGNATDSRPNLLLKTDFQGNVLEEVGLPPEITACRAASTRRGTLGSGFEGVAVLRGPGGAYRLAVAQQRGWDYTTPQCEELDDDAGGFNALNEPNETRLWIYDPQAESWSHVSWELAPKPENAAWVGLSEITEVPGTDGYIVIERDNRTGDFAVLKTLVKFDWSGATGDGIVTGGEKRTYDLLPNLNATNGWITDKPEGVAVTWSGVTYVVTDNDAVDDWSGESWFFDLGRYGRLFR